MYRIFIKKLNYLIDTLRNKQTNKTNKRLKSFEINENDLLLITKNLNTNKAHGWDDISIRMIQACGKSITLPLKLLFKTILEEGTFPEDWKKSNVVRIHKKESKNLIKNYRPISLLPIFSNILERLIFNSIFNYFRQNNLFTECQSGFIPGDSCVAQLLSITHEFYQSFDCSPTEILRGFFLDISKGFDKVWHEGLLFKLRSYRIEGSLLRLLKNYLTALQQRVVLNGQTSLWLNITAGVPQGSVVGHLLDLIYINDLPDEIFHHVKYLQMTHHFFEKLEQKLL